MNEAMGRLLAVGNVAEIFEWALPAEALQIDRRQAGDIPRARD